MYFFVEKLSLGAFLSIYLFVRERDYNFKSVHVRYIINDRFVSFFRQFWPKFNLGSVKIFDFSFDSLVDENGTSLGKKVVIEDLEEIYRLIDEKIEVPGQFK